MAGKRVTSTSEAALMVNIGRRHFLNGQSKNDIADVLGISRFRVARLLERALEERIVRIEVGLLGQVDAGLGHELEEQLDLERVIVVDTAAQEDELVLRRRIGTAALELLGETMTKDDVVGLASARPLLGVGDRVEAFPACTVVQLTGAVSRPDALDIIQSIRDVTRVGGGQARVFYAPIVGPTPSEVLRQQPDVARAFALFPRLTAAVVGVGSWAPGLSTIYDTVGELQRREAHQAGVRHEIAGIYLDQHGEPVEAPLRTHTLGIDHEALRVVPQRIGLAFGLGKAESIRAGAEGKIFNSLITHRALAESVLSQPL